ncbi:uncharacterized protein EAF02_004375 [Botrytis sinoallii]|uniref:uncharacterized protein n=1 Tax=Botrytis sinoallii TaxID=1463999 RepID=UPI00190185F7|nr:uncharacterized protein EAF02_004375 [Botrytis sinoallii]KAF7885866.1 hypothetical protein EAF02_004375 [Botrytis sinoallii]
MSTNNSQVLDSHESSPALHSPEDSGSDDTSNTSPPRSTIPKTLSELHDQNIQLHDEHLELRCQNAELKDKNDKLQEQNTQLQDENTKLRAQITQDQDKNAELRIQNAQLQAQVEKHVAIARMRERLVQPVKQDKQDFEWHFWIWWMIFAWVLFTF